MGLPVAEAHPAEVVLAVEALHVVAAAVLLDADAALWALKKQVTLVAVAVAAIAQSVKRPGLRSLKRGANGLL